MSVLAHRVDGPADAPAVLLLNGGMMSMAAWDPVADGLLAHERPYRVVRCDLRGQLRSPTDAEHPGHRSFDDHADDVAALLGHLAADDPPLGRVHVIGVSFGAEVALALAARHGERVRSLVAVTATDVATDAMRAGARRMLAIVADIRRGGGFDAFRDELLREVYAPAWVTAHREQLDARLDALGQLPDAWFAGLEDILHTTAGLDLRPHLPHVDCPSLVVIAGLDRVMERHRSLALASALGAEVAELPEAGHGLLIEHPQWLTTHLLAFLDRQEAL